MELELLLSCWVVLGIRGEGVGGEEYEDTLRTCPKMDFRNSFPLLPFPGEIGIFLRVLGKVGFDWFHNDWSRSFLS